jgi:hypothetical protein
MNLIFFFGAFYMNYYRSIIIFISFTCSVLSATDFTICSYNCGGLSDHYDYVRAAGMQKLMQERYIAEPGYMSLNEKIQQLALKILFTRDSQDKLSAQQEWNQKGYQHIFENLTAAPTDTNSPNAAWYQKVDQMITSYKIRPISIFDEEVDQILDEHLKDISKNNASRSQLLKEVRATMAKRIFAHYLKYDIICLQEADYLDDSMFPKGYEVLFAETPYSKNGIAWNKDRFELVETIGNIIGRAFAIQLLDKESNKTILVASGHITGCNPYRIEKNQETGAIDSAKGDTELQSIVELLENHGADFMLIGMDSNVTSLHPRLNILNNAGFQIDYENYIEPTCTNPYQVLNTRIDWIALKSSSTNVASVVNIPVLNVGLNSIQTNISDHKPIAAKVKYAQ